MSQTKDIVLAFSGGLDTSFCIPYLQEQGYAVHTVFADTGGVDADERDFIEKRAAELGAASHVTVDGGPAIWEGFVKPFVWAGEGYQGQYPLLVSDRYLIVDAALARATMASAFQRISEPSRSSMARSPGKAACCSTEMLLTYGVTSSGDQPMRGLAAMPASWSRMNRARAGPWVATSGTLSAGSRCTITTSTASPAIAPSDNRTTTPR